MYMDLRYVVKEQREELDTIMNEQHIIERERLTEARSMLSHPNVLALIGIRRCGKSIFSYQLAKDENFGYLNFDDERLYGLGPKDLNDVLEAFYSLYGNPKLLVLDEVQNVPGWELFVNRLRRTKRVLVTGSSSGMLSGELATKLTGRHLVFTLFPFSFREHLDMMKVKAPEVMTTGEKVNVVKELETYIFKGGLPEVHHLGNRVLPVIFDNIVSKDVMTRGNVRKFEELKQLARFMVSNYSSEFTYRGLKKSLGLGQVSTVSNWLKLLEEAFLIFKLERFDSRLKNRLKAPKKIYCTDPGIIDAVSIDASKNMGRRMENIVAVELMRRKVDDPRTEVHYWKDHNQNEVDFMIKVGNEVKRLIQVTYADSVDGLRDREVRSLLLAGERFGCKDLEVITWDLETEEVMDGRTVRFVPLYRWLLGPSAKARGQIRGSGPRIKRPRPLNPGGMVI